MKFLKQALQVLFLILIGCFFSACKDMAVPTVTVTALSVEQVNTTTPVPALTPLPPQATQEASSATQMRAYAPDAANLLTRVDLNQTHPISAEETIDGQITSQNLAVPFTYEAEAGQVLYIQLLLPNLPETEIKRIRPAIFVMGPDGSEIGYTRGGEDFVDLNTRRSIAQAGFVVPKNGLYTILATLDGNQKSAQAQGYEADFSFTLRKISSLSLDESIEATRVSTETQVYALMTTVGVFDLLYEELSEDSPGQYAIDVFRLGSPVDGLGLQEVMASTGAFDQTFIIQDNDYASIADQMDLTELTYLIFVDSFSLSGQEQIPSTSHYRLTIIQHGKDNTPTVTPTPIAGSDTNPENETWITRLNHTMHVEFQLPAGWELEGGQAANYIHGGASLLFQVESDDYQDAAAACQALTQGISALAFGVGTGEVVQINGIDVCVLLRPDSEEPYRAFIKYKKPLDITGSIGPRGVWNFLRIDVEPSNYFWPIINSINFPEEPSASVYASGVLDILKANYYFRDAIDWYPLETEFYSRLNDQSTREDAYDALHWLINQLTTMVNHDHMFIRNPQQAQEALAGKQFQVGLQTVDNLVSIVFPNSPAASAGMQIGDEILTVNGDPFAQANFNTDSFDLSVKHDDTQFEVNLESQVISYILPPRSQHLGNVAYLETFGIFGADLPLLQTYTANVQNAIKAEDSVGTCGWILDLRRNTGGSIHAIMAGIAPFVGNGGLYHIRWPNGYEDVTYYKDGQVYGVGTVELPAMAQIPYTLSEINPPLAVLVSRGTASAGEVSAIVVSGRPDSQARIFGEQTPGLTTPVFEANLYDGGLFYAPIQLTVDLEGNTYLEGVIPDELISVVYDERFGTRDDPVVQAALAWLKSAYGCAP